MTSILDPLFFAAFLQTFVDILAFFIGAWGALFIAWAGVKAARRMFWVEAEPWKGAQTPLLEEIRRRFGQRIALGVEFFLAAELLRLLTDISPALLVRIVILVAIRIGLSLIVMRELHALDGVKSDAPSSPARRTRKVS